MVDRDVVLLHHRLHWLLSIVDVAASNSELAGLWACIVHNNILWCRTWSGTGMVQNQDWCRTARIMTLIDCDDRHDSLNKLITFYQRSQVLHPKGWLAYHILPGSSTRYLGIEVYC